MYFDDQRLYGGLKVASVPRQTLPVWTTQQNKPRLRSYKDYALDGYSFL
jgi:hypothetical protein